MSKPISLLCTENEEGRDCQQSAINANDLTIHYRFVPSIRSKEKIVIGQELVQLLLIEQKSFI